MDQSDVELMLRVRDGDPDAFALVVERHQRPLLNYFYRLTWDRQRSEDLAQEVFLRLFRARETYSNAATARSKAPFIPRRLSCLAGSA